VEGLADREADPEGANEPDDDEHRPPRKPAPPAFRPAPLESFLFGDHGR
jgi:hypothetical protein